MRCMPLVYFSFDYVFSVVFWLFDRYRKSKSLILDGDNNCSVILEGGLWVWVGEFVSPSVGPMCPGYRGAQVPNIAVFWVQGWQLGERDGCTCVPLQSALLKLMSTSDGAKWGTEERANCTLYIPTLPIHPLPYAPPPTSIPREIWTYFYWLHHGFSWDGIRLFNG